MSDKQLELNFDSATRKVNLLSPDEIFQLAETLLDDLKEDSRFERKPPGIHAKHLAEYISMWANTGPEGGLIVIGSHDDGTLPGMDNSPQKHINRIEKCGREYCPDARYDIKRVPFVKNGVMDFVILIRVYYRQDKVIETTSGDAFVRRGDSKFKLSEEEKRELSLDKGQVSLEQEPCGLQYPDDFDHASIRRFAKAVIASKGLRDDHTPEQILANRKLGKIVKGDFVPNIACALLFALDPQQVVPGCSIRFQRLDGTERLTGQRRNVVKDARFEGTVPEIISQAAEMLQSQSREFSQLGKDGKFYSAPEYPQPAWYEALVNACVHRSYNLKNMTIFIRMFDDRLEIESPGGFPPNVTAENIYEIHHRRNYFLMDAMFYMDLVKCENEGTRRMRDEMIAMSLPAPEFDQKEIDHALVRVTLRNDQDRRKLWIDKDATDVVGEAIFGRLDERERRCINFAAEHIRITVAEAARINAIDWKTAKRIMTGLVDARLMKWVGRYKGDSRAHYELERGDGK